MGVCIAVFIPTAYVHTTHHCDYEQVPTVHQHTVRNAFGVNQGLVEHGKFLRPKIAFPAGSDSEQGVLPQFSFPFQHCYSVNAENKFLRGRFSKIAK